MPYLSENAVARLHRLAGKNSLTVNGWVQDLRRWAFTELYDLIISFGTLHFVPKEERKMFPCEVEGHTTPGGIHIIQLFTNDLPPSADIAEFAVGFADDGEIQTLYEDWNILQFRSYTFGDEHPGVPKHRHAANKIIAQKPKTGCTA